MRKMFAGLTVAAFAVVMTVPVFAKTETVTGQIVDQTCYMKDKANTGANHNMAGKETADCAAMLRQEGRAAGAADVRRQGLHDRRRARGRHEREAHSAHQPYRRGDGRRHREGRQDDDRVRRAEDDQEIAPGFGASG